MSFGGATSAMIASIKNNKRPRKSAIEKLKKHGYYDNDNPDQLSFNKTATEEQLEKIRQEAKKENRRKLLTYLIPIGFISIAALIAIGFVKF
ncbi:Probable transmembrane protein of unknown function [Tenacibaculum jejuense]|uniref:Uncharacterized protein n=2 Tax=Tenacibaculum jejuense TaxID=584609 RepID=A0A238U5E7_9FLAO|nr:Probable transmembrane protein of unknown function [Tenacibaculum jejuense]